MPCGAKLEGSYGKALNFHVLHCKLRALLTPRYILTRASLFLNTVFTGTFLVRNALRCKPGTGPMAYTPRGISTSNVLLVLASSGPKYSLMRPVLCQDISARRTNINLISC